MPITYADCALRNLIAHSNSLVLKKKSILYSMDTFSLTQEELADDVLWDEKGTHASQNTEPCSGANQLMPSRK